MNSTLGSVVPLAMFYENFQFLRGGIPRISVGSLDGERSAAELRRPVTCLKQSQSSFSFEPLMSLARFARFSCAPRSDKRVVFSGSFFRDNLSWNE